MTSKLEEKRAAIALRRKGKTYSEILDVVPVAKSTLAIWLYSVGLSKKQKQRITKLKLESARRGGQAKKNQRMDRQRTILAKAKSEIAGITDHELFLIGIALYWAEGAKEKDSRPGSGLDFVNMDPEIIQVFIVWLTKVCKVPKNMIIFVISLHQTHRGRVNDVRKYWSKVTGFPVSSLTKVQWKRGTVKTHRKNIDKGYHGALKIRVRRSSSLVREISGWSEGIFEKVVCK